ncbi:MAG: hypothetical protein LBV16_09195 [Elusimicrobiota bacterium]|jgi:hypothetical protein|nr:hypothetical protein [Elusimicrobiota bacterium]
MLKKTALKSIVLIIPIILILLSIEFLFRGVENNFTYKKKKLLENSNSIELLLLGDSRIFRGLDPKLFSFKTFNLGNDGERIFMSPKMIEKYADSLKSLKIIVVSIGSYEAMFGDPKAVETGHLRNYKIYYGIKFDDIDRKAQISDYLKLANGMNFRNIEDVFRHWTKQTKIEAQENGYFPPGLGNPTALQFKEEAQRNKLRVEEKIKEGLEIGFNNSKKYVEESIAYCQKRHIKLVFVTAPAQLYYRELMSDPSFKLVTDYMTALTKQYKDVYYYDFTNDASFTDADFGDIIHVNNQGAEKFSKKLNAFLQNLKNAPVIA